jgi:hypothetical protein
VSTVVAASAGTAVVRDDPHAARKSVSVSTGQRVTEPYSITI